MTSFNTSQQIEGSSVLLSSLEPPLFHSAYARRLSSNLSSSKTDSVDKFSINKFSINKFGNKDIYSDRCFQKKEKERLFSQIKSENRKLRPNPALINALTCQGKGQASFDAQSSYEPHANLLAVIKSEQNLEIKKSTEIVLKKKLDIPNLVNDYYSNILDISKDDTFAIALNDKVYFYDLKNGKIFNFDSQSSVASLRWINNGKMLAVGTKNGFLEIRKKTQPEKLGLESFKISSKPLCSIVELDEQILAIGDRNGKIFFVNLKESVFHGVRGHQEVEEGHLTGTVCGLALSFDGKYLASGGNDNKVKIWAAPFTSEIFQPLYCFDSHKAATKALAWNPHPKRNNILATGGGALDKTIKLWDVEGPRELFSIDAIDGVTGLHWIDGKYLVSTHGRVGDPRGIVCLWSLLKSEDGYSLKRLSYRQFHDQRILYSACINNRLVTAAEDETLNIYNISSNKRSALSKGKSLFDATIR